MMINVRTQASVHVVVFSFADTVAAYHDSPALAQRRDDDSPPPALPLPEEKSTQQRFDTVAPHPVDMYAALQGGSAVQSSWAAMFAKRREASRS